MNMLLKLHVHTSNAMRYMFIDTVTKIHVQCTSLIGCILSLNKYLYLFIRYDIGNRGKPSVKYCYLLQDASLLFVVAGTLKLLQQVVGKEQKEVNLLHQFRLDLNLFKIYLVYFKSIYYID